MKPTSSGGLSRLGTIALSLMLVLACSDAFFEPPGGPGLLPIEGGASAADGLAGTWTRELVFFDEFGYLHSSETTWVFAPGGSASRTIVTANVTLAIADTALTTARWRVDGSTLVIDFIAPSPGTITLDWRIEDTTLFLAGQEYQRAE